MVERVCCDAHVRFRVLGELLEFVVLREPEVVGM